MSYLQFVWYRVQTKEGEIEVHRWAKNASDIPGRLTLTYSAENQEELHELDWRVDMKEEAEREANRRLAAKAAALSKLSKEERELLGL